MPIHPSQRLLNHRRTKIVATLGPSSTSAAVIGRLIEAGVNVFRLNFSHGTQEGHREVYQTVRAEAERLKKGVAILADLCGPKIRVGMFAGGSVMLVKGEEVTVTTRQVEGGPGLIPSQYEPLARDVRPGQKILLDDGNLSLEVVSVAGTEVSCLVIDGGLLKNKKGMNMPRAKLSVKALTEKDISDARFALGLGVDFLALSFVRQANDILELREIIHEEKSSCAIIAKIEMPEALGNIEKILGVADGIMVARGDLGVELPLEQLPPIQDQLVNMARRFQKPVIVATQMLESMIENARPTRAEVTDISTAVRSGADAVMLSAETAAGKHPVETVLMMDAVLRETEAWLYERDQFRRLTPLDLRLNDKNIEFAVGQATAVLARDLSVRGIIVSTKSGHSAAVVSSFRPPSPIVVITPDERVSRFIMLLWGAYPLTKPNEDYENMRETAQRIAVEADLVRENGTVLVLRGFNPNPAKNMPGLIVVPVQR